MAGGQNVVGQRIREARKRAGLSQYKLGIAIGVDPANAAIRITRYERGTHFPDYQTVQRIGLVCGYPTAYFYSDSDAQAEIIAKLGSVPEGVAKEICNLVLDDFLKKTTE